MLFLLTISVFFIGLIYGMGTLFSKILKLPQQYFPMGDTFWLGFCALIGILQVWHFFAPINDWLLVLLSLFAIVGIVFQHNRKLTGWKKADFAYLILLLLPLLVLLNHSLYTGASYDFGLYHLQTVKWFNNFAIVPGLGNLQHRLAFNSSQYLYAAFLNTSIFKGYSYYTAEVILLSVLFLQSLDALRVWIKDNNTSAAVIFRVLMIPILLWQAGTQPLAGYPADMTVFILQVVVFEMLLRMWSEKLETRHWQSLYLQIVCLSVVGMTIKLSFAIFGLLAILAAFLAGLKLQSPRKLAKIQITAVAFLGSFWLLPWLLRNVFLSGYLLYPSRILSVNVPWKMPAYLVDSLQEGISLWAKTYSGQLVYTADLAWLWEWFKRFVFEGRSALLLGGLLLVLVLVLSFRKKSKSAERTGYWLLFIIVSVSLLAWFFSAPTYRFSGALIWLWLLVLVLMLVDWIKVNFSPEIAWRSSIIILIFLLVWLPNEISRNISLSNFLIVPKEQVLLREQTDIPQDKVKITTSGLEIHLPAEGESCWDLPLPCTTPKDFLPMLNLINPQDMSKGFYLQK